MAGIEPGPCLLKSGSAEKKREEKNGIGLSPLKHTLNNSCYSLMAWGEHSTTPFWVCLMGLTKIAHYSELLIFTMGVYTSDNSGKRHQRRWLTHSLMQLKQSENENHKGIYRFYLKHKNEYEVRQREKKSLSRTVDNSFWFVVVDLRLGLGDALLFVSLEDTFFMVFLACSSI